MFEQTGSSFYKGLPSEFQQMYVNHLVSFIKDCLSDPVKRRELDKSISAQPTNHHSQKQIGDD